MDVSSEDDLENVNSDVKLMWQHEFGMQKNRSCETQLSKQI
jgi:hypothetical protein